MTPAGTPELDTLVRYLRESGIDLKPEDGWSTRFVVAPRGNGGPTALVEITEGLLREYLEHIAASYGGSDPLESARGLAMVHVVESLSTDHGRGVNTVRRLSLVREDGEVRFVEQRDPPPAPEPMPGDGPFTWTADREGRSGGPD